MLLVDDIVAADMEVVLLNILCFLLHPRSFWLLGSWFALLWQHNGLVKVEWFVAQLTVQVLNVRIPVLVHQVSPLLERIEAPRCFHEARRCIIAFTEFDVLLLNINLQIIRNWFLFWKASALTAALVHPHNKSVEHEDEGEKYHFADQGNFHL